MEFVPITPEQRASFEEDGFLVIRKALQKDQLQELVATGDEIAVSFLRFPENHYLDQRPGILHEEPIARLVAHAPTVSLVAQLMGPNIHLHSTALIYKKPEGPDTPPRRGWHRDMRIPKDAGHGDLPRVGMKVCYCLTDFHTPNSGMTLMVRGSNHLRKPLLIGEGEVDPTLNVVDHQLNAGDAVIFENRTFHSRAPNLSDRMSRVIMFGYAYRWMKPEFYLDVPEQRLLEGADPITRQLLGFYRDMDATPKALRQWAERHGCLPEEVPWHVETE